jgi:prepilin-type N-terminal cleavage/methylation domain-containing protein
MRHRRNFSRAAFTLVELLVVIAIIGVLVALLLPAIQAAREAARRSECLNHLKQIGLAIQYHHDALKRYPMGRNTNNQFGVSWAFSLLPFTEQQAVHDGYVVTARVDSAANTAAMRTPIAIYACSSRRAAAADRNFDNNDNPPVVRAAAALGDYAANAGLDMDTAMVSGNIAARNINLAIAGPIFSGSRINARRVIDGQSSTLAVGERHIPPVRPEWLEPMIHYQQGDTAFLASDTRQTILCGTKRGLADGPDDATPIPAADGFEERFGGPHPGVTLFVFLDGHADAVFNSIDVDALKALSTIGGREVARL